jgi:hypothetical protein
MTNVHPTIIKQSRGTFTKPPLVCGFILLLLLEFEWPSTLLNATMRNYIEFRSREDNR